jgi:hypothetical protein
VYSIGIDFSENSTSLLVDESSCGCSGVKRVTGTFFIMSNVRCGEASGNNGHSGRLISNRASLEFEALYNTHLTKLQPVLSAAVVSIGRTTMRGFRLHRLFSLNVSKVEAVKSRLTVNGRKCLTGRLSVLFFLPAYRTSTVVETLAVIGGQE